MQGFELKFNVYANTKQEADEATKEIVQFINELAQEGKAVTATKIAEAIRKYKRNIFVTSYFK